MRKTIQSALHGIIIWAYIAASLIAGGAAAVLGIPGMLKLMTPDASAEYAALRRDMLSLLPLFLFCAGTAVSAVMLRQRHAYTLRALKCVLFYGLWLMPLMSLTAYLRDNADDSALLVVFTVNLYVSVCLSCFAKCFVKTGFVLTACCIASGIAAFDGMHKLWAMLLHSTAYVSFLIFAYLYYFTHAAQVRRFLDNASSSAFAPENDTV
jgi:hypothetical protein